MTRSKAILIPGLAVLILAVVAGCAAQSEDMPAGEAADGNGVLDWLTGETATIPAGTSLTFTLGETISTETSESGDTFTATLADAVVIDGRELIPAGATATGQIAEAVESGRVRGRASIRLTISEVEHDGDSYDLETSEYHAVAEASTGEDAATIGAGAGIGAAVGAVLGGGDGAAKGAAIGGGGGTAVVLATTGDDIELPAGTRITFVLSEAVEIAV
jgi:hypothetical protein